MTISDIDDKELQRLLDDIVLSASTGNGIPLSRLALKPEYIKKLETKLKSENTNDTN